MILDSSLARHHHGAWRETFDLGDSTRISRPCTLSVMRFPHGRFPHGLMSDERVSYRSAWGFPSNLAPFKIDETADHCPNMPHLDMTHPP